MGFPLKKTNNLAEQTNSADKATGIRRLPVQEIIIAKAEK